MNYTVRNMVYIIQNMPHRNIKSIILWVQTQLETSRCFLEQFTSHLFLSTGWFQERNRECIYKIIAAYTIEQKYKLNIILSVGWLVGWLAGFVRSFIRSFLRISIYIYFLILFWIRKIYNYDTKPIRASAVKTIRY